MTKYVNAKLNLVRELNYELQHPESINPDIFNLASLAIELQVKT
jgi:hypothetical protein